MTIQVRNIDPWQAVSAYLRGDVPFFAERVRIMYASGISTLVNFGFAIFLTPMFIGQVHWGVIVGWLGALLAFSVLRLVAASAYSRRPSRDPLRWAWASVAMSFSVGLCWSAFEIVALQGPPGLREITFVIAVYCMSVANMGFVTWLPAYMAFPTGSVIGLTVYFLGLDLADKDIVALILVIGWLGIGYVGWLVSRVLVASISLRLTNAELIEGLRQERDRAESAAHSKSDFLATMSHEIRTPLNGLLGMLQLLLKTNPDPRQREYLETARYSADALIGLIDDILDYSKVEAGKLRLEKTVFSPRRMAESVITLMAARAGEKNLTLRADYDASVPPALVGDAARIRQILLNFVSNAIKFTTKGSVVLSVGVVGGALDRPRIRFSVRDTGIGISSAKQAKLFEPYAQADASIARRFGGTGLGLSISRRLAEAMGGSVGVDSELGRGSTFWFDVDLLATQVLAADTPVSALGTAGLSVLVADDTSVNRQVASGLLSLGGHRVVTVANGEEALERIAMQDFDIVLLDVRMPGIDGYETTRRLRRFADPRKANIPVIAITANVESDEAARCFAAGMNDYVAKPVTAGTLDAAIRRVTRRADGVGEAEPVSPENSAVFDDVLLRQLLRALGPARLGELVANFKAMIGEDRAALDEAWRHGNLRAAAFLAHRIGGAATNIGCMALGALADRIEVAAKESRLADIERLMKELVALTATSLGALDEACGDLLARPEVSGSPAT